MTVWYIEIIGYISALCFIICALPLAIESYQRGRTDVNLAFLSLWYTGEVAGVIYSVLISNGPMFLNCFFSTVFTSVVVFYYIWPRKSL